MAMAIQLQIGIKITDLERTGQIQMEIWIQERYILFDNKSETETRIASSNYDFEHVSCTKKLIRYNLYSMPHDYIEYNRPLIDLHAFLINYNFQLTCQPHITFRTIKTSFTRNAKMGLVTLEPKLESQQDNHITTT